MQPGYVSLLLCPLDANSTMYWTMQTLLPVISTPSLDSLLQRTLRNFWDIVVTTIQKTLAVLEPIGQGGLTNEEGNAWLAEARSWEPPLPLFNWYRVVKQLWEGVLQTAHLRYMGWHSQLCKRYHSDSELDQEDSGSDQEDPAEVQDGSETQATRRSS